MRHLLTVIPMLDLRSEVPDEYWNRFALCPEEIEGVDKL